MSSDNEKEAAKAAEQPQPAAQEQSERNENFNLKSPAKDTITTTRGRLFEFGKPALKHRKVITKCLRLMQDQKADFAAINKCAEARKMPVEDFVQLDETEWTTDEKRAMLKRSDFASNVEMADMMNDMLAEVLYATVKKAPFTFSTLDEFEDRMDDYGEAVELFPNAIKWISASAADLANINRKNS